MKAQTKATRPATHQVRVVLVVNVHHNVVEPKGQVADAEPWRHLPVGSFRWRRVDAAHLENRAQWAFKNKYTLGVKQADQCTSCAEHVMKERENSGPSRQLS
jgi:hypothetical protein